MADTDRAQQESWSQMMDLFIANRIRFLLPWLAAVENAEQFYNEVSRVVADPQNHEEKYYNLRERLDERSLWKDRRDS